MTSDTQSAPNEPSDASLADGSSIPLANTEKVTSGRKFKVFALSAGKGLTRVIGMLAMMVMARELTKTDLAAYRQTFLAYSMVIPILGLGVGQAMYYFLPAEKERMRGRVMDGIAALGAMGLLFALFVALGGNELLAAKFSNPQVARLLLWLIPYAIVSIPASATESVLVARDKALMASVFGVFRQLLVGISTIIPLIFWSTAEAPLIGNVVASILMGIVGISLMFRAVSGGGSPWPKLAGIRELLFFAVPLALGGMISTISKQLDQVIVTVLRTPAEFAEYSLGAMELPLVGIITGALTSVMLADMRKSIVEGDKEKALRLFHTVGEKSSLVMLPVMVFLLLTADTIIQYLYTAAYADSAYPFRVYLTLLPIRTVVFGSLLLALGLNKFVLYRCIAGLIFNLVLSAILVWQIGPIGAAVATVATMYFCEVPACIIMLAHKLEKSWLDIMPYRAMARIMLDLIPVTILSLIIMWQVENIHVEFLLISLSFALFSLYYWNEKLYSLSDIQRWVAKT